MDRGAWYATVHGVAKSQTRLSDFTYSLGYGNGGQSHFLEMILRLSSKMHISKPNLISV